MNINTYLAKRTLQHTLHASYWRGYGVHSPFVYHLVRHIINCRKEDKVLKNETRKYRASLLVDRREIVVTDLGTGAGREKQRCVNVIARNASVSEKYGLLLSRLIGEYKPKTVIELGTSLGISTQYIGRMLSPDARFVTVEGSKACADIAKSHLCEAGLSSVDVRVGNFDDVLPSLLDELASPDFVYVDGNHTYEATKRYFELVAQKATVNTMIVFDDIHWSLGMSKAWEEICEDSRVMTSVDLLHMGIVFFRTGCQKEHYLVRW